MSGSKLKSPKLYTILREDCDSIAITSVGEPGVYTYPSQKFCGLRKSKKRKGVGRVEEWGETYSINCPECGDTKNRLYVSHYTGATAATSSKKHKDTGEKVPCGFIEFGTVAVCHNEHCNVAPYLKRVLARAGELGDVVVHAPAKFSGGVVESVPLPLNFSLFDSAVPNEVLDYIADRRYTPDYLEKNFDIRYMPPGTFLWKRADGTEVKSWDPRLLIPVYRAHVVIGWQARIAQDVPQGTKVKKYLFPPTSVTHGEGKSSWFYNGYEASYCKDIVIVEGVTDVWRIGLHALCIFGKTIGQSQIEVMKEAWGSFASCVIVFDGDPDAWKAANKLKNILREQNVFPGGVTALRLGAGYDPDNYTTEEINLLIDKERLKCR